MLNCYDTLFFTIIIYVLAVVGWKLITAKKAEPPQRFELVKSNPRSSKWKAVRNNFIKTHGWCAVCGKTENLVVHHKEPFHLFPEKELDPTNLVTLCEKCHDKMHCSNNEDSFVPLLTTTKTIKKSVKKVTHKKVKTSQGVQLEEL